MAKYKNKYRIESNRLQGWDYSSEGMFITICTKNRVFFFGDVVNGKMILSEIGQIVESEWLKTFEMRPDMNLAMGEYIVMPNHFHAILIIGQNEYNSKPPATPYKNKFGPQSKNVASIIRDSKQG